MLFCTALYKLQTGGAKAIRRKSFESAYTFIKLQVPDKDSMMTAPYLYVKSLYGMVPWNPTQIEILADDWVLVDESPSSE